MILTIFQLPVPVVGTGVPYQYLQKIYYKIYIPPEHTEIIFCFVNKAFKKMIENQILKSTYLKMAR